MDIRSVFVYVALLPAAVFGQVKAATPIKTTLCEMAKDPTRFNGQMMEFRAEYVSKFQWTGLQDENCSTKIPVVAHHVLDDLRPIDGQYAFTTSADDMTHPERLTWESIKRSPPVRLIQDQDYVQLRKYANAKFRWKDGGVCTDCPLFRIMARVTARFDYFEKQSVVVRANTGAKPFGFSGGDPNSPLYRAVLQKVSDVTATPVDPSIYAESRRRNVSLEEANALVYALLNGCSLKHCPLEEWHDPDFPDFYGLEALNDNPTGSANIGFFAVDPRTADVWNGVICERFTSPSLLKLQRTIRQRIGLTEEEYRKIHRQGPMCGPGMPRISGPN